MYWHEIESSAAKIHEWILENHKISDPEYELIFDKYIEPFFYTWNLLASSCNGDILFAPVAFCWYANKKGMEPDFPIRIMRFVIGNYEKETSNGE